MLSGWSTGPTSALTFYVLGLQVISDQGMVWSVAPSLSGLSAAEGGFETALGWFGVKWNVTNGSVTIEVSTPNGTNGTAVVPGSGAVEVDGQTQNGTDGVVQLDGGNHTLTRKASS